MYGAEIWGWREYEEIERMKEMGRSMKEELSVRDIVKDEVPKYRERESIKKKRMMARFRCGNAEKENNFWRGETDRRCRVCWREGETIEHMLEVCEGLRKSEDSREEVLNEDGSGLEWMKEVWKIRELWQGVGKQKE
ncbi:hypothetical protein Zmor_002033 [Zophobas morio]|uniref:Uncharacterized protein n=1 Tax=Zophobas morio TaxID=2755281 RepID=A0AA38J6R8_9CUCU|nr:hypothetical protein Zmor_002033 [Zophobas morio]